MVLEVRRTRLGDIWKVGDGLGWLRGGPGLWEMKGPREGAWHFAGRGWYGLWGSGKEDSFSDLDPMGQRLGRSF